MNRMIDADALLELYADRLEKLVGRYGVYSSECGVLAGAMKLLEIQPTIEPERKTGKWEKVGTETGVLNITYSIVKCSKCGWEHSLVIPRNYCPHCGAKMEGAEQE